MTGIEELRFTGFLALVRTLPLLDATSCAGTELVKAIATAGPFDSAQPERRAWADEAIAALRRYNAERDGHDNYLPDYTQSWIATIASALIDPEANIRRQILVFSGIEEVWSNCDYFVDRAGANRDPMFLPLKTTLLGVEYAWQERDAAALKETADIHTAYATRLAAVRDEKRWARRCEIAERIAELAGWRRRPT